MQEKRQSVLDFIRQQGLLVLSTTYDNGKPQAAVIGFGETDNLELIFGTNNASRKYKNLKRDPHVAAVIGWSDSRTVQFEGIAEELSLENIELVKDTYWRKNPRAEAFHANPGQRYFIVRPTWIRYTNIGVKPWDIIELTF